MEIRNLVAGETVACGRDVTLADIASLMISEDVGSVAVVDGSTLLGIVTERDMVRALAADTDANMATAREWMTVDPDVADPDLSVEDAARWMLTAGYRHLPVVEGTRLMGVVSIKDVLWALDGVLAFGDTG
ncbi:MAG: CBS domain-containing protein [Acidimicrobiia bacterium]|nr:CBS domain-containing protein [Acidimicrobiia bacterium]